MSARKSASYILHMAGITQSKQEYLISLVVPQGRENFSQIRSK